MCSYNKGVLSSHVLLSLCTGLQVNNPAARLPYSKIEKYGITVEGLPEGKILKHPSSYGPKTLKAILSMASKDSIKLKGIGTSYIISL